MATAELRLQPLTTAVGVLVEGADLREPLKAAEVDRIRETIHHHGAVFFRDQELTTEQFYRFASCFGTPIPEPFRALRPGSNPDPVEIADLLPSRRATSVWHHDSTYFAEPPSMSALQALQLPEVGGDTCWGSMYAAYDALSKPMQKFLEGLTAVHSAQRVIDNIARVMGPENNGYAAARHDIEQIHPVIRVHPHTNRKALFVNEAWTTRIVELEPAESARVLSLLFEHVKLPDFFMRWRWRPNDVVIWDNIAFQHYAVPDYTSSRVMMRTTLAGEKPFGTNA